MASQEQVPPQQAVIRHAQDDMAHMPPERAQAEPQQPGMGERFLNWVRDNHANNPNLSGQIGAMIREAVKDVRATLMETYFGKPEHHPEMGAPGNPTPQNVSNDLGNFHGYGHQATENDNSHSYGQTLADTAQLAQHLPQQQQERGRSR